MTTQDPIDETEPRIALVRVLNDLWRNGGYEQPTIGSIADAVIAAGWTPPVATKSKHARPIDCSDHRPVQHRDGRPPWCLRCGCDVDGHRQRASDGTLRQTAGEGAVPSAPEPSPVKRADDGGTR